MSMKVSTRQVDGVTIVDCSGRITLGEGSVVLRDTVDGLLGKGQKKILLNLTKKVHDLLQITKLYTVFDVKDDEAAAVKSFS